MNELIKSQRKAIQMQLDKLKKETNPIKIYLLDEDIRDMENNLSEMMKPKKSMAFHGDHESVMHPEERKKNPLISK